MSLVGIEWDTVWHVTHFFLDGLFSFHLYKIDRLYWILYFHSMVIFNHMTLLYNDIGYQG